MPQPDTNTHPEQESLKERLDAIWLHRLNSDDYQYSDIPHNLTEDVMHLIEQDREQAVMDAEDKIFKLLLARCSDVTLRDYGGNERSIMQVVDTTFIAKYWASIKNDRKVTQERSKDA